jgi:hypothetical protein
MLPGDASDSPPNTAVDSSKGKRLSGKCRDKRCVEATCTGKPQNTLIEHSLCQRGMTVLITGAIGIIVVSVCSAVGQSGMSASSGKS